MSSGRGEGTQHMHPLLVAYILEHALALPAKGTQVTRLSLSALAAPFLAGVAPELGLVLVLMVGKIAIFVDNLVAGLALERVKILALPMGTPAYSAYVGKFLLLSIFFSLHDIIMNQSPPSQFQSHTI